MRLAQPTVVNLASIVTAKGLSKLLCPGLGSCIAVCALDPTTGAGGIAHLMLPTVTGDAPEDAGAKFVTTGMPAFLAELEKLGATPENLRFAIVGGARLFSFGVQNQSDLGSRNVAAVQAYIGENHLTLVASDTGGCAGRSLSFTVETGEVLVRTLAFGERELCNLKKSNPS